MPKIVDHQQRRDAIAEVAARCIASRGLEHTTIREIARLSGFSKGIIEHYFESKEDLIASALDWVNRRYEQRVAARVAGRTGFAALRARLEETLPLAPESIMEWQIRLRFWSLAAIDARFQAEQSRRWIAARAAFAGDLRAAHGSAPLPAGRDPSGAADRILFMVSGISAAALHSPGSVSRAQLLAMVDELASDDPDRAS